MHLIYQLLERFPDGVHVTAPTGVAACNIGGTTLHSFGGIGMVCWILIPRDLGGGGGW